MTGPETARDYFELARIAREALTEEGPETALEWALTGILHALMALAAADPAISEEVPESIRDKRHETITAATGEQQEKGRVRSDEQRPAGPLESRPGL